MACWTTVLTCSQASSGLTFPRNALVSGSSGYGGACELGPVVCDIPECIVRLFERVNVINGDVMAPILAAHGSGLVDHDEAGGEAGPVLLILLAIDPHIGAHVILPRDLVEPLT